MSGHQNKQIQKKKGKDARSKKRVDFRKYQDRRFRQKETVILEVFFNTKGLINTGILSKKTGISKSTFYRHHHAMKAVEDDYEKFILYEFSRYLKNFKGYRLKETYRRMLCFIVMYRRVFRVFSKRRSGEVFRRMIYKLGPKFTGRFQMQGLCFEVYIGETIEVLKDWAKRDFKESEMELVLKRILFLTNTAKTRLGILNE